MKPPNCSLAERFALVKTLGVEFFDYGRSTTGVLLTSGCGIGLGLMDACPNLNWFCDIDTYRFKPTDWEAIAVLISAGKPKQIVLAGWFTIDVPEVFHRFGSGIVKNVPTYVYVGGHAQTLASLIAKVAKL